MEVPRHWRLKQHRYRMVGENCRACGAHLFPPRPVCPHCGSGKPEALVVEGASGFAFDAVSSGVMQKVTLRK